MLGKHQVWTNSEMLTGPSQQYREKERLRNNRKVKRVLLDTLINLSHTQSPSVPLYGDNDSKRCMQDLEDSVKACVH